MKKRMAALVAVMGLMAAMAPATAGAKPKLCGGTHYVPFTHLQIPFC